MSSAFAFELAQGEAVDVIEPSAGGNDSFFVFCLQPIQVRERALGGDGR